MICETNAGQCAIAGKFLRVITLVIVINSWSNRDELYTFEEGQFINNLLALLELNVWFDRNLDAFKSERVLLMEFQQCFVSKCSILASSQRSHELLAHLIGACDNLGSSSLRFSEGKEVVDFRCSHLDQDIGHFSKFRANIYPDKSAGYTTIKDDLGVDLLYVHEELVQGLCLKSIYDCSHVRMTTRAYHSWINLVSAVTISKVSEYWIHVSVYQSCRYCFNLSTFHYQTFFIILRHHFIDRDCFIMSTQDFLDFIPRDSGSVNHSR